LSRRAVRRLLVTLSLATIGCVAAIPALAQDAGTIRMVVPFDPGTTTDSVGRVVADGLSKALKQNVVVDNRAGAGGVTGSDQVAKSPPDGRTLVMGTVGTHAINATLFKKLPYDAMRDFAPVAFVGYTPTLLLREQGIEQRPRRADEMTPFNVAELAQRAKLVKSSGAQVD